MTPEIVVEGTTYRLVRCFSKSPAFGIMDGNGNLKLSTDPKPYYILQKRNRNSIGEVFWEDFDSKDPYASYIMVTGYEAPKIDKKDVANIVADILKL